MTNQVGNKNIDNASGQVVRLDIQNTVKAVATHNFGPRNSAGTILPCEFLADDTTNKLLIRKSSGGDQANPNPTSGTAADFFEVGDLDTANLGLLPKTGGTLTGVLELPTGSVSAPALTVGDTGTGLFKPTSNILGVTADGTKKLTVSATATEFFGNATTGSKIRFLEAGNNGSNYVELKAADSISNNLLLTLPTADGTSGQALLTNGSGTLSFGAPTVGAADLTGNTLANGVTASSLTSVGTLTALAVAGTCTAGTFSGSAASLTNIPAANLTGSLPAIDGSALTNIPNISPVAFFGRQSSDQSISANSLQVLKNFTEISISLNTGSSWNKSNGRFTVASGQAGIYVIYGIGGITGQRRQKTLQVAIAKNGTTIFRVEEITRHNNSSTATFDTQSAPVILIMSLSVGDYVELELSHNESSSKNTEHERCVFGGFRISE